MTQKQDDISPWQIISSKTYYQNPWIKIDEYQVINPAGNPGIYGTVSFKNRAVGVVPLAENGDTWLVGQYRFPLSQYHWEIPMGGCPLDEDPAACALRELKEETGLIASELMPCGHAHMSNCITNEEGFVFVARGLEQGETEMEETEVLTIRRLPFDEVFAMVMDGRITDALSVLAIQRIRLLGMA
ncbi:NUDIX domain-containing protein [Thalassolituus oleivorans]|uniref:GDP-mannose pyrophosphatase n=1 Tax=Thalassolituus oleivorans MIL-1 TaxID=1298593 RepID=M5DR08_9GAMM|nr:NUDIX hydrolase [Thalassolituus oleivorans]CCU71552.1 MutT/NUDIX family protein [Thalassolituus oleivorans MIL-1]